MSAPLAAAPESGSDRILERLMGLHPKIIDLTLDRVWRLLARLDHPERALPPVVHIAGTNGKGSVTAMLRAGLEGAGAAVHAYTSPHLVRFHERIRLAGRLIEEEALAALLEECEAANGAERITYFEITTVAALLAFARCPADWTLLEVGLGGRLDATNVVDAPRLTVITPVSMDHQQYLGDTLAAIAGEKAGILKPGVPVIVAQQSPDALQVIERRATELGAPLCLAGRDFTIREMDGGLVFEDAAGALTLPRPALPGHHQIENAGVAIAALRAIAAGDPAAAMERVAWPARLQRLTRGPLAEAMPSDADLWLDGGHNPAAGAAIAAHFADRGSLYVIAGMLETKDAADFARPFAPLVAAARTVTIPDTPASLTAAALAARFSEAGIDVKTAADAQQALASFGALPPGAQVLICGSLYLAGQVLARHG